MTHPIEVESFRRMDERVDLSRFSGDDRAVVARVIHATADPGFASTMVVTAGSVEAGIAALVSSAPVLCDAKMTQAGISLYPTVCYLGEVEAVPGGFPTRSARAMRLGAQRHPEGAVVAIGCAPSALEEALDLFEAGEWNPALVVGVPVGFVGATESKQRLLDVAARTGLPCIANIGERGGSAAACAVINALSRLVLHRSAVEEHQP